MTEMTVAAVQTAPAFGEIETNVTEALALVPTNADLAVLPELFSTGYQFRDRAELADLSETTDGPTCTRLRDFAAAHDIVLVAGLAERDGDGLFNSSVMVHPDGRLDTYRKVHLFWDEKDLFEPGDLGFPVQTIGDVTVGMMVCFDWIFPEAARSLAIQGAKLICHPSNLVLPFCPEAMITRCLENRVFAITTNRVGGEERIAGKRLEFIGRSQIVTPLGARPVALGDEQPGACTADIDLAEAGGRITPRNDVWADRRPETYR